MMEYIETIIIGGGQAGLATSYYLKQHGREHIVFEQAAQPASAWRSGRWDSFTLVTPNWTMRLPGAEYDGPDRDGFMSRDEVVTYFETYIERFQLPVQYNTCVVSVEPWIEESYRVRTAVRDYKASNVVIASGYEQQPKIPPFAANLSPAIFQLHSSGYRSPAALPDGAVLVVGSAQSGGQIAEELQQNGRKVFLCTGGAGRAPRRYRGKDGFEWLYLSGFFEMTPDRLPFPKERFTPPHLSGTKGGHTLNLHQFARDGMMLLGHMRGAAGDTIYLTPDLRENLAKADNFEQDLMRRIDAHIQSQGIDAPVDPQPQLRDGYEQPIIEELDLNAAGIKTVLWATGYTRDYSMVKLPIRDASGSPIQTKGATSYPGLYFTGMPWMPSLKTGTLVGISETAWNTASHILDASVK